MEWSDLCPVSIVAGSDNLASLEDADLVIMSIMAPAKDDTEENGSDDDDEEDENDNEKEETVVVLEGLVKTTDENLDGALTDLLVENAKAFKNGSKLGSMTPTLRIKTGNKMKRYVVMGLGQTPKQDKPIDWTGAGSTIGKAIAGKLMDEKKVVSAHILLPETVSTNATIVKDIVTAIYDELHTDNRYKTKSKVKKIVEGLETVQLFTEGSSSGTVVDQTIIEEGKKVAAGVLLAKDIVNAPHNVLNSESLADTAKRIAKEAPGGRLKCEVLGKKECEARGMGAFLGVARGSETEPQFIHLTYTPNGTVNKKVGVVGKGLLFDTGGYNIKTQMMELSE